MPIINIDDGEDWLKQYQRYKATIWYKRISRKQWAFWGGVGGLITGLLIAGYQAIPGMLANFSGPSISLFGGF